MSTAGSISAFRGHGRRLPAAVAAIAVLAGVVSGWNFGHHGYWDFYSDAARSMSLSWRAFFFGSFDPGATITLDKLAGFLVPQALSARIFGFHPWSVVLPEVVEGMVTVVAAYVIGTRWKGPTCGLLAAAAVTTTPLLAAMFGRGEEDCLLTMSLALAFLCWQTGMLDGRLRPLLFTALWIAIGFQAKMMQAWLILPAIVIAYLVAAPHPLARRFRRAGLMVGLTVVLSLSWITAIMLVPAADRPYIDGSTHNNGFAMVFGYNGFNRVIPDLIPGAVGDRSPDADPRAAASVTALSARLVLHTNAYRAPAAVAPAHDATPTDAAEGSPAKLVDSYFLTQIGWFYPLTLAGLALGLCPLVGRIRRRRSRPAGAHALSPRHAPRMEPATATVVALGTWLVICATFLTIVRIPHTAYLSAVGVQVALLAAGGLTEAISMRSSASRAARTVLPVLIGVQTFWAIALLLLNGQAPGWILPATAVVGVVAVALLVADMPSRRPVAVVALGLVAVALAPGIWTGFVMTKSDTSEGDPYAGPHPQPSAVHAATNHATDGSYGFDPPFHLYPNPALSRAQDDLVAYVRAHPGVDGPMMATDRWMTAQPYIQADGLSVMPFGGFSGTISTPGVGQLADLVSSGRLRFVLLHAVTSADAFRSGGLEIDGGGYARFEGRHVLQLRDWVQTHCAAVPASDYAGPKNRLHDENLYACAPSRV